MVIALYFGSFNPMHTGHIQICRYLTAREDVDQVRLMVSHQNPLKGARSSTESSSRMRNVKRAVSVFGEKIKVSGLEYTLRHPLYTINTIRELRRREPGNRFILVIGADNLAIIEKWHKWEELLKETEVWVYPRKGYDAQALCAKYGAKYLDAPVVDISSTQIREGEAAGKDMSRFRV